MKKRVSAWMLSICVFAAACSSDPVTNPTTTDTDTSDVLYEGGATDEALDALVAAPVKTGMAPGITAPTAGQAIPKEAPFTFTWTEPKQAALLLEKFLSIFEGTAHAHGTPVNGVGYFLTFSTASNAKLLRVFTPNKTYVPSADAWNKLLGAKTTITLRIRAATFEDNRVIESGGPFDSQSIAFTVKP